MQLCGSAVSWQTKVRVRFLQSKNQLRYLVKWLLLEHPRDAYGSAISEALVRGCAASRLRTGHSDDAHNVVLLSADAGYGPKTHSRYSHRAYKAIVRSNIDAL